MPGKTFSEWDQDSATGTGTHYDLSRLDYLIFILKQAVELNTKLPNRIGREEVSNSKDVRASVMLVASPTLFVKSNFANEIKKQS